MIESENSENVLKTKEAGSTACRKLDGLDAYHHLRALIEEGEASGVIDAEPKDVIEQIIADYPAHSKP